MPTYKLIVEYEGTRYRGWQEQQNARTVTGELRHAIERVAGPVQDLGGSGRTDAGVHAAAQVAHLRLARPMEAEPLRLAVNELLPADIHILAASRAHDRFHARHEAVSRTYLYQVALRRTAFAKKFVWWVKRPLDAGAGSRGGCPASGAPRFRDVLRAPVRTAEHAGRRGGGRGGPDRSAAAHPADRLAFPLEDGPPPRRNPRRGRRGGAVTGRVRGAPRGAAGRRPPGQPRPVDGPAFGSVPRAGDLRRRSAPPPDRSARPGRAGASSRGFGRSAGSPTACPGRGMRRPSPPRGEVPPAASRRRVSPVVTPTIPGQGGRDGGSPPPGKGLLQATRQAQKKPARGSGIRSRQRAPATVNLVAG